MIISHKHKFIFIKTKKTTGTSVEIFLSNICGLDDIVGNEINAFKEIFNHYEFNILEKTLGYIFVDRFSLKNVNQKNLSTLEIQIRDNGKSFSQKKWFIILMKDIKILSINIILIRITGL